MVVTAERKPAMHLQWNSDVCNTTQLHNSLKPKDAKPYGGKKKQKVSVLIKNYKSADFPIKRMTFKLDINMDRMKSQRKLPDYAYNG